MAKDCTKWNEVELAALGLTAYKTGDYLDAIDFFKELRRRDNEAWECRLFLAMACIRVSRLGTALHELKVIIESCPDPILKDQALKALKEMNRQSHYKLTGLRSQKK